MLKQIYRCKFLSIHGRRKRPFGNWCCWWPIHRFHTHRFQLLMKLLFESLQTSANLLLVLMPANYIPTRCVNPCLPVFIRVGNSIQKRVGSQLDKTRPAALKIWSCPISNEQDQNVKLKASLQQADKENRLLQCWWVLFSLQHCVWSHGLRLPLLSLSRAASFSHWRGYSTWYQEERTRCIETTLYTRKMFQG